MKGDQNMAITVNTNMQALRIQQNLTTATKKMNQAMERMSSGSKINCAGDDAAGYAVSTTLSKTISSSEVASDNVAIGTDLLSTTEGTLDVILKNLERVRDLTEQASNGTYSSDDLDAIAAEVQARLEEIEDLATATTFNGKSLLDNTCSDGIALQIGTETGESLKLDGSIFESVNLDSIDTELAATIKAGVTSDISDFLNTLDTTISNVTGRITDIGALSNRLEAVANGLEVQQMNLTSALSTILDTDVAKESAAYVQQQILQSASATLLVQANSAPQIALTLIQS